MKPWHPRVIWTPDGCTIPSDSLRESQEDLPEGFDEEQDPTPEGENDD